MADREHPKTHVEDDKDAKLPRKQPESPRREGIDPLTEGDTMYPATDTKAESTKLTKKNDAAEYDSTTDDRVATDVANQEELNARANTPNEKLSDETKTATSEVTSAAKSDNSPKATKNSKDSEGEKLPQTAKPTNPSTNDGNSDKGDRK